MELQNAPVFARVIMALFILLFVLAVAPLLYDAIQQSKINLYCSDSYGIICLILDLALPFIVLFLLSLLIYYLKGGG